MMQEVVWRAEESALFLSRSDGCCVREWGAWTIVSKDKAYLYSGLGVGTKCIAVFSENTLLSVLHETKPSSRKHTYRRDVYVSKMRCSGWS